MLQNGRSISGSDDRISELEVDNFECGTIEDSLGRGVGGVGGGHDCEDERGEGSVWRVLPSFAAVF